MKLYEIADEIERILAREVDRETGEITDDTLAKLDQLEMDLQAKALAVAAYLKGERCEGDAVAAEAEKLRKRAQGHYKRAERLAEYLAAYVPKEAEYRDARSVLVWRKNPPKAEIVEEAKIPRKYRRTIPASWQPDKKAILDALKIGLKVAGARLTQSQRLEIK